RSWPRTVMECASDVAMAVNAPSCLPMRIEAPFFAFRKLFLLSETMARFTVLSRAGPATWRAIRRWKGRTPDARHKPVHDHRGGEDQLPYAGRLAFQVPAGYADRPPARLHPRGE